MGDVLFKLIYPKNLYDLAVYNIIGSSQTYFYSKLWFMKYFSFGWHQPKYLVFIKHHDLNLDNTKDFFGCTSVAFSKLKNH